MVLCPWSFHGFHPFPTLSIVSNIVIFRDTTMSVPVKLKETVIVMSLTSGSWQILQEVVPRWAEASTAAGSRFNDCNLLAFKDTLLIFA